MGRGSPAPCPPSAGAPCEPPAAARHHRGGPRPGSRRGWRSWPPPCGCRRGRRARNQQGHREPDPREQADGHQVAQSEPTRNPQGRQPCDEGGRPHHADELAQDQTEEDREEDRLPHDSQGSRALRVVEQWHPGGEECEHRQDEPRGDGGESSAQHVGAGLLTSAEGDHGDGESQQDTCDRGMDARGVHRGPGQYRQWDQQGRMQPAGSHQEREDRDTGQGAGQGQPVEPRRVEDGDDDDRQEVVDDGQGEQEGAQGTRETPPEQGEDPQCEGDVRGGGGRPPVECTGFTQDPHGQAEDHGGHRHATDCRKDGDRGRAEVARSTGRAVRWT